MESLASATIHKSGNQLHVSHGDDKGLFVEFYMEAMQNYAESETAGHPVFHDVPFIRIRFPGDTTKVVERPVRLHEVNGTPSDPQRWPRHWEIFQSSTGDQNTGLPLTEWPPITKSVALTLKGMHIHTVEQLADVQDNNLTWLGARELRAKAQSWLASAAGSAETLRLQTENAALRADIDALTAQFAELASQRNGKSQ